MLDHCFEFYESRWRRFFESKRRSKSLKAAWQPIYHSIDRYIQQWSERRGCGIKNCLAVGEAGSCPSGVSSSRLYDTSTSAQVLLLAAASWGQPTMCCSSRLEAARLPRSKMYTRIVVGRWQKGESTSISMYWYSVSSSLLWQCPRGLGCRRISIHLFHCHQVAIVLSFRLQRNLGISASSRLLCVLTLIADVRS